MKIAGIKKTSFILITLLFFLTAAADTKVAVYITGDVPDNNYKKVFTSKVISALTKIPEVTPLELNDSFIDAVVYEHNRNISNETDGNEPKESDPFENGKKYGAKYIVAVELTELFDEAFVSSHIIDVETAEVLYAYDTTGKVSNLSQLIALADSVVDGLIMTPFREKERIKEAEKKQEQEQLEEENRQRERRERKAQEEARRQALRKKAFENLTPYDCIVAENLFVRKEPKLVEFYGCNKHSRTPRISFYIPDDFKIADEIVIRKLASRGLLPDACYITNKDIYSIRNYKSSNCSWYMSVVKVNKSAGTCSSGEIQVCTTRWKNGLDILSHRDVYVVLIKSLPSEYNIDEEVRRLINSGY